MQYADRAAVNGDVCSMKAIPMVALSALWACSSVDGELTAGYIQTELSGTLALDSSSGGQNLSSRQVDVRSELGLTDPSDSLYLRGEISPGIGRVTVSGFRYDQAGSGTLGSDFGDIPAGTQVSTDTKFGNLKASWAFDLFGADWLFLGPGFGVDLFDIDVSVTSSSPSAFERIDVLAPIPMVFLQSELTFGPVSLWGEGGWMSIDLGDGDGTYWDFDGMLRVRPHESIVLFGGYRYIDIEGDGIADGRRFEADLQLDGWYVGGGISF